MRAATAYGVNLVANGAAEAGLVGEVGFAGRNRLGRSCGRRRGRHKYPTRAGVSSEAKARAEAAYDGISSEVILGCIRVNGLLG